MLPGLKCNVYAMINKKTGRKYYGRTSKPVEKRVAQHIYDLENMHGKPATMIRDHKHGWEYEVIKDGLTQAEANELSDRLAKEDPRCYNILGIHGSNRQGSGKVTLQQAKQIRNLYWKKGVSQHALATKYGLTQGYISLLVNGLTVNDGSYRPPKGHPSNTRYRASQLTDVLKRDFAEAMKSYSGRGKFPDAVLQALAEKHLVTKGAVRDVVCDRIQENYGQTSNLYHKIPEWVGCRVNGEIYPTLKNQTDVMRAFGAVNWDRVTAVGRRDFVVTPRVLTVDGVQHEVMGNISEFLRPLRPLTCLGPGVYVTSNARRRGLRNPLSLRERRIKDAQEALKDPVRSKSGRVMLLKTSIKYSVGVRWLKEALAGRVN